MQPSSFMSRRELLAAAAMAGVGLLTSTAKAQGNQTPVIVELFTSQGCSSCPPADALLIELKSLKGVVALSFHVDYWDYLGWRDTLGDKAYSERQYAYARTRGDTDVYTPQMVVNGKAGYVGSSRATVKAAIAEAQASTASSRVALSLANDGKTIAVTIGAAAGLPRSTLWLMSVAPSIAVKIKRGENAGRDIDYHNVVRRLVRAGPWDGKAKTHNIPTRDLMTSDSTACVALLQTGTVGPVLGSAVWGTLTA